MLLIGDCREIMPTLSAESFDSIVTDPPYGLSFMGKGWDHQVPGVEFWAEALRVAKPGAWLVAFGGTRKYHRLAVAIEDAGWELRDCAPYVHEGVHLEPVADCPWLLAWVYGSGFPKSHNLEGEFEGFGTALKPAWEPIILARKPMPTTVLANMLEHGTGALNIAGCRVYGDKGSAVFGSSNAGTRDDRWVNGSPDMREFRSEAVVDAEGKVGRWPANLIHDGSAAATGPFPDEAGAQAPVTVRNGDKFRGTFGAFKGNIDEQGRTFQGDSGSAARFFYCAKASKEDREAGVEHWDRKEGGFKNSSGRGTGQNPMVKVLRGNHHPTVKPTELMRWLVRLVTPPGGHVLDPFCGSGSTGRAASAEGMQFTGIELDPDYAAIAEARIRNMQPGLVLA